MSNCNILSAFSSGGGGGATTGFQFGGCDNTTNAGNTIVYAAFGYGTTNRFEGTEATAAVPINMAFTLIRISCSIQGNGKNGATTVGFRDDASTIGSLSVTASTNGDFDSGALSVEVDTDSDCCFIYDRTASNTGEIGVTPVIALCTT